MNNKANFHIYFSINCICCLCCIFWASLLYAEGYAERKVLILQSDDSRLKMGQEYPITTTVRLPPKAFIRLISKSSGEIYKIIGPYSASISSAILDKGSSLDFIPELANAILGSGSLKQDIGAYRNVGKQKGPPRYREEFVRIIVGEQGSYCITPKQSIVFWRPDPPEKTFSVRVSADTKGEETVIWPAGTQQLNVPESIRLNQPRRLVLSGQGDFGLTSVRLRYGEHGETPAEQLHWYHKFGCQSQFESALMFYQTF